MNPIIDLTNKLEEIAEVIKNAYRNELDKKEIDLLVDVYNNYFYAIQLLDNHSEIDYDFSRMFIMSNNKIQYRFSRIKNHRREARTAQRKERLKNL